MTVGPTDAPTAARTFVGHTSQARLTEAEAVRVLARVRGMTAPDAVHALRFSAGTICPAVARLVQEALAAAERERGPAAHRLCVVASEVGPGEVVTRVRRLAHGRSDWITTRTTAVRVELGTGPAAATAAATGGAR